MTLSLNTVNFFYSRNPMVLSLSEGEANTDYRIRLFSEPLYHDGENVDTVVAELIRTTDGTGGFSFRFDDLLDAWLGRTVDQDIPAYDESDIVFARHLLRRFQLTVVELNSDGDEVGEPEATDLETCIYGARPWESWKAFNEDTTFFANQNEIICLNQIKSIRPAVQAYICWLATATATTEFTFSAAYEEVFALQATPDFLQHADVVILLCPAGAGAVDGDSLSFSLQTSGRESEVEFDYDATYYPFLTQLLMLTALGGVDVLACTGNPIAEYDTQRSLSTAYLPDDLSRLDMMKTTDTQTSESRRTATGFMLREKVRPIAKAVLNSKFVYEANADAWLPVVITSNGFKPGDGDQYLESLVIEYRLAWEVV